MAEVHAHFELVEFELVEAAPGTALLRVAARPWPAGLGAGGVTLVISDGPVQHRHEQLPALPGPSDLSRLAFSAPIAHVSEAATFALSLPDGQTVPLPAPSRRRPALSMQPGLLGAGARPGASGPPAEGHESSRLVEAERRAESRRLAVVELERRLRSERERRAAAESDIAHLRAERDDARGERDTALNERDAALADRNQAEARALAAAASAGTLEAQIRASADAAVRAQNVLEGQLADSASAIEQLRAAAELAQARAQASRREATALGEQLAYSHAQVAVLQQSIEDRDNERAQAAAAMEDAVALAREEALGARERLFVLKEELADLRDAAARSDAQHTYDLETAQARLEVAHAEIEVARTQGEALLHHSGELEATLAELDAALARRGAEIDLLRESLGAGRGGAGAGGGAGARAGASGPELQRLLDAARVQAQADASLALSAQVDLLRAELVRQGEFAGVTGSALTSALERARAAEDALGVRARELKQAGAAVERAQADARMHERRASDLGVSLSSAQRTLHEARDAISAHEHRNRELGEALRAEEGKRLEAEGELLGATVKYALLRESMALAAERESGRLQPGTR